MGERSRRRVRDLVTQLAFEGLSENEIERARISMMARSDLLHARAGYRSARPTTVPKIQLATQRSFAPIDRYVRSGLWQTQNYPLSVGSLRDRKGPRLGTNRSAAIGLHIDGNTSVVGKDQQNHRRQFERGEQGLLVRCVRMIDAVNCSQSRPAAASFSLEHQIRRLQTVFEYRARHSHAVAPIKVVMSARG
jgi:hypothetical protein